MTAHIPPTEHKEIDFFEEVEKELLALTTAKLEERKAPAKALCVPLVPPLSTTLKTVVPTQAGIHAECDVPTENDTGVTQRGHGSSPTRG